MTWNYLIESLGRNPLSLGLTLVWSTTVVKVVIQMIIQAHLMTFDLLLWRAHPPLNRLHFHTHTEAGPPRKGKAFVPLLSRKLDSEWTGCHHRQNGFVTDAEGHMTLCAPPSKATLMQLYQMGVTFPPTARLRRPCHPQLQGQSSRGSRGQAGHPTGYTDTGGVSHQRADRDSHC